MAGLWSIAAALCLLLVAECPAERSLQIVEDIEGQVLFMETTPDGRVHFITSESIYYRYIPEEFILEFKYPGMARSLAVDGNSNVFVTLLSVPSVTDYTFQVMRANNFWFSVWREGTEAPNQRALTFVDEDNFIYLADSEGVHLVDLNNTRTKIEGLGYKLRHYGADGQGNMYFSHGFEETDYRLAVLDAEQKTSDTPTARDLPGVSESFLDRVLTLTGDSQGNLFLSTYRSLKGVRRDGTVYMEFPQAANVLRVDRNDTLYFATDGELGGGSHGVYALPLGADTPTPVPGLQDAPGKFVDILVDTSNNVYFAGSDEVHVLFEGAPGVTPIEGINGTVNNALLDVRDSLMVLAEYGHLYTVAKRATLATQVPGILPVERDTKYLMRDTPDSSIYFGTDQGLYVLLP